MSNTLCTQGCMIHPETGEVVDAGYIALVPGAGALIVSHGPDQPMNSYVNQGVVQILQVPPHQPQLGEEPVMATSKKDAVLRKVRGLLAKAEDPAATPEEAEAFSAKAEELIATYAIDLALIDAKKSAGRRGKPETKQVPMEAPYKMPKVGLLHSVADPMGVRMIRHGLTHTTLIGFGPDLDAVDLLYTSLLLQASNALREARKANPRKGEDLVRFSSSFLDGFATTVWKRLRETRKQATEAKPGTSLVLADRSDEVDALVTDLFPNLRASKGRSIKDYSAYGAGSAAGAKADLGGSRVGSGSKAAIG